MSLVGWVRPLHAASLAANAVAATLAIGILLTAGVAVPPLLPPALAGATGVAVRWARGRQIDPVGDSIAAIRAEIGAFVVLTLSVAVAVAVPAWLVVSSMSELGALAVGVRFGLAAVCASALAVLVFGAVIATSTTTPTRAVPLAGVALAVRNTRASVVVIALLVAGLLPIGAPAAPAILPVTIGLSFALAVRVAWRAMVASL